MIKFNIKYVTQNDGGEFVVNWEALRADFEKDLEVLIGIKSDRGPATVGKPYGEGVHEIQEAFASIAERDGFTVLRADGHAIEARWDYGFSSLQRENDVAIIFHGDKVPSDPKQWSFEPYKLTKSKGFYFGRGVEDDIGPGLSFYYALLIEREIATLSGATPTRAVRIVMGGNEESGMQDIPYYFKKFGEPAFMVTPDSKFPVVLTEMGIINQTFTRTGKKSELANDGGYQLDNFRAGIASNMVPEHCEFRLICRQEYLERMVKSSFKVFCEDHDIPYIEPESGQSGVKFTVQGISSHGSEPEKGKNAAILGCKFLRGLGIDSSGRLIVELINQKLVDHKASAMVKGNFIFNLGIVEYEGGSGKLVLSTRFADLQEGVNFIKNVEQEMQQFNFFIEETRIKAPHIMPPNHPLVTVCMSAYESVMGEKVEAVSSKGGTYAGLLPGKAVSFGFLFPGRESTAHQSDEHVSIQDVGKAVQIYAAFFKKWREAGY